MNKKQKTQKLLEELNAQSKSSSKSEIAQKSTKKEQKVRDVKQFIAKKTSKQLDADTRAVIQQRRSYMLDTEDNNTFEVFNATMYVNTETQQLELFSQKIAHTEVQKFVANLKYSDRFVAQDIMRLLQTRGGAYGDKVRNALYAISMLTTREQLEANVDEVVRIAKERKKQCIYYNTKEDSSRKFYEFIKIA